MKDRKVFIFGTIQEETRETPLSGTSVSAITRSRTMDRYITSVVLKSSSSCACTTTHNANHRHQHQCLSSSTLHATTAGSKGSNSHTPKRKRSVRGCMLGAPGWNNGVATYYVTMYPGERSERQCTLGAPGWNDGVATYPGERFERRRTLDGVVTNNDKAVSYTHLTLPTRSTV